MCIKMICISLPLFNIGEVRPLQRGCENKIKITTEGQPVEKRILIVCILQYILYSCLVSSLVYGEGSARQSSKQGVSRRGSLSE